jgi:hypothetical protein
MMEAACSSEMSVKIHQTAPNIAFFMKVMWKDAAVVSFKVGYYVDMCLQTGKSRESSHDIRPGGREPNQGPHKY